VTGKTKVLIGSPARGYYLSLDFTQGVLTCPTETC